MPRWLDEVKQKRDDAEFYSKALHLDPKTICIDLEHFDRLIAIAEQNEYDCICKMHVDDEHKPTCPYSDEWEPK